MSLRTVLIYILYLAHKTCSCTDGYGPFKMMITKYDVCTGPKNKDCAILNATILGGGALNVDVKVTQNCNPSKGKIVAISNGRELVRLQMNKPCDHLFLRPLLENMFTVTKDCVILKVINVIGYLYASGHSMVGDYKCKFNMEQMANSYFGGKFFYGNVTFKSVIYGNDCNFSCTELDVTLTPKK